MNRLLTPQEIADYLGVKTSTVYQWTHQGFIPHVKLGRFVRFRESEVIRWLETRSETGRNQRKVDMNKLIM